MFTAHFEKTAFDVGATFWPAFGATVGASLGGEDDMKTGEVKNRWIGGLRGGVSSLAGVGGYRAARKMKAGIPLSFLADVATSIGAWKAMEILGPKYDREKRLKALDKTASGFSLSGLHKAIKPKVPKNLGQVDPMKNVMPRPGGKPKYKNSLINPADLTKKTKPKLGDFGNADSIRGSNKGK